MRKWFEKLSASKRFTLGFFLLLIILQIFYIAFSDKFNINELNFGAEYSRVAVSVYNGQGFGNVWGDTGPSAAVSPFLVYLLVGTFYIFGLKSLGAFFFLTLIKHICLALSFYLLLQVIQSFKIKLSYYLYFLVWIVFILFSPSQNFIKISDLWMSAFILSIFIYAAAKYFQSGGSDGKLLLILFFLFAPIINPSIALAAFGSFFLTFGYLLLPLVFSFFKPGRKSNSNDLFNNISLRIITKDTLTFAFAFLFFISLWSVRNYTTFGKFIPTKSNMWLEFYLSNVVDTDGQLSFSTSFRGHPLNHADLNAEMIRIGEIAYIERYQQYSHEYLESDFDSYKEKVLYRLYNAFIFMENDMDAEDIDFAVINKGDLLKLNDKRLTYGGQWISLFYDEIEMQQILNEIKIDDKNSVIQDWKKAKEKFEGKKHSIPNIVRSITMSLIPIICMILLAFNATVRRNPVFMLSVILYIIYLLPYVLISHQIRYQRPLFILQILFIFLISSIVANRIKALKSK